MDRRHLLKSLLGISVATAVTPLTCVADLMTQPNDTLKNNALLFNAALAENPLLSGLAGVEHDFAPRWLMMEGKLPHDLRGMFYRNGPALHQRGMQRYSYWFEGDGMIQQFAFSNKGIQHQGKFVRTSKFKAEQAAGKLLYSGSDSRLENSLSVNHADVINPANTNVIQVNGELWALWEAGSATAVNNQSLETKGKVNLGQDSQYANSLAGMPFSAHPRIEADGTIWNFGLSPTGDVILYQLNPNGKMANVGLVKANYHGGMLHDFLITHRHILLVLPSIKKNKFEHGFFSALTFDRDSPMRVLVIDKASLTLKREYQLDAGFVFHFGNAWEDKQGTIHFDASLYSDLSVIDEFYDLAQGKISQPSHGKTVIFSLYANGSTAQQSIKGASEFPRIYEHLTGLRNTSLITMSSTENDFWNDTVRHINIDTGNQDNYVYGKDYLVEEHIIVDNNQKEGDGYLIGTALHIPSQRTCVNVFKANRLADGPICRAWLPHILPLGIHGNFVTA